MSIERGARDLKGHTSEMCELQRTLDNEMKLQEFLGVKGQYREMADLKAKKEAERQAKREEMQNQIAIYTQILALVKQFTGTKKKELGLFPNEIKIEKNRAYSIP